MQKNIGDFERVARVIGGGVLASMAFWGPKKPWYLAFAIPAIEGAIGNCALYSAFNINTRSVEEDQSNVYFPAQSPSERAAGNPIVGVS
jgi:hypothetical protein